MWGHFRYFFLHIGSLFSHVGAFIGLALPTTKVSASTHGQCHEINLNVKFVENTSPKKFISTGRDCVPTNTLTAHTYRCSYESFTVCLHMSHKSENPPKLPFNQSDTRTATRDTFGMFMRYVSCPRQRLIVGHCIGSVRVHEHDVIEDTSLILQV